MFTHHSAHTKYISMGQKKRECGGFNPGYTQRERKMQSEIKCEPCCSSSNWYSDFYSEIYSCRPFLEFSPFTVTAQSTKPLTYTGMVQSLCSVREGKELGEKIDHLLKLPRL